jgi:hypothetical protein
MHDDASPSDLRHLRRTDSNSLLRLYDLARQTCQQSTSQQERVRADRAVQRIARELQKRNVRL